ncbi:hypothetical protein ELH92_03125 [Rhizobium ruizarguesonis]|nr:hypothetical protein ELH92_03125 [Rhizobium ruizarguesonis]TAZ93630.1 hypothetical protein ELH67_03145 [Rhizobium ruizarguesonis]TBC61857.1 hypothetical protein ELH36_03140 [Rhizobium ruizarguesonis]
MRRLFLLDGPAGQPPHPPYGHLLPEGRRGNRDVAAYLFSPRGEGAGRRMRGPHGTPSNNLIPQPQPQHRVPAP